MEMPAGLPGFPNAKRFVLLERAQSSPFRWLQCLEGEPTFLVADPLIIAADYPIETVRKEIRAAGIEIGDDDPMAVAVILTVPPPPESPSANMLAPIAVSVNSRKGAQIILHDSPYSTREPLPNS